MEGEKDIRVEVFDKGTALATVEFDGITVHAKGKLYPRLLRLIGVIWALTYRPGRVEKVEAELREENG